MFEPASSACVELRDDRGDVGMQLSRNIDGDRADEHGRQHPRGDRRPGSG